MKNVVVYSTPTCHFCHMAKDYFTEKGVQYKDVNVAGDMNKIMEMRDLSGQTGVPVIVIDKEVIVGFDKPRIDMALGLN